MIFPEKLATSINELKEHKGSLIMILHAVQEFYGYVPKDVCFQISNDLNIPIARIYEVLTFYNYFRLEAPAQYKISVCFGTACYLKGSPALLQAIKNKLNIKEGEVSHDKLFRLETARCFGCCGLAPVIMINDNIYGQMTPQKVLDLIEQIKLEAHKHA